MARTILKRTYFSALAFLGVDVARRRALVRDRKAAVLNLHRVSPVASPYWPPMHPHIFEALLKYLDKHFEVRSLETMDRPVGKRPVAVLSFDDGYYDFVEYALPLLRKYRMPANMNIIPECAESGRPIWNVRLYDFLAWAPRELIEQIEMQGFDEKLGGDDAHSKLRFGMALSKFLKTRSRTEREQYFQSVEQLITRVEIPATRMMSSAEIRHIAADVEMGVHSYSHESMAYEEQRYFETDFGKCKEYFDKVLLLPLKLYAFPNGSYRNEQIEFLRKEGMAKILLVDEKFADIGTDVIPRITMYGDSPSEVQMRASGF